MFHLRLSINQITLAILFHPQHIHISRQHLQLANASNPERNALLQINLAHPKPVQSYTHLNTNSAQQHRQNGSIQPIPHPHTLFLLIHLSTPINTSRYNSNECLRWNIMDSHPSRSWRFPRRHRARLLSVYGVLSERW